MKVKELIEVLESCVKTATLRRTSPATRRTPRRPTSSSSREPGFATATARPGTLRGLARAEHRARREHAASAIPTPSAEHAASTIQRRVRATAPTPGVWGALTPISAPRRRSRPAPGPIPPHSGPDPAPLRARSRPLRARSRPLQARSRPAPGLIPPRSRPDPTPLRARSRPAPGPLSPHPGLDPAPLWGDAVPWCSASPVRPLRGYLATRREIE
jgi:hypothetical protein